MRELTEEKRMRIEVLKKEIQILKEARDNKVTTNKSRLFTADQKTFFAIRKIKTGSLCQFPLSTFSMYLKPSYGSGQPFEVSLFGKNLSGEFFRVTEIDGKFVKGNFERNPTTPDFYLEKAELETRPLFEMAFLFLLLSIPFMVYNLFKGQYKNKQTKTIAS